MSAITARSSNSSSVDAALPAIEEEKQALTRSTPSSATADACSSDCSGNSSSNSSNQRRSASCGGRSRGSRALSWRHVCVRGSALVAALTVAQWGWQQALLRRDEQSKIPVGLTNQRGRGWRKTPWQKGKAFVLPNSKENTAIMKKTENRNSQIFNENHTITLADLADLTFLGDEEQSAADHPPHETWEEAARDRGPILDILERAGLRVNLDVLQRLPTWTQVVDLYGDRPVVVGRERCAAFRAAVPAPDRYVGVAGQMNTGTNALSKYLKNNVALPENPIDRGVLWTVPWYKHGWAGLRHRYRYRPPENHDHVMAVVTIREPYFWMQSMCESPYTMEWHKSRFGVCPNLIDDSGRNTTSVRVRWSKDYIRSWPSLADLWSSWYREYLDDAAMPRLLIRFEDLLFHTEAVLDEVRECVGADWRHPPGEFRYQSAPAKTHPYFTKYKPSSSLVSAMIKYGWDNRHRRVGTMTAADLRYANRTVDADLQELFHYPAPELDAV